MTKVILTRVDHFDRRGKLIEQNVICWEKPGPTVYDIEIKRYDDMTNTKEKTQALLKDLRKKQRVEKDKDKRQRRRIVIQELQKLFDEL